MSRPPGSRLLGRVQRLLDERRGDENRLSRGQTRALTPRTSGRQLLLRGNPREVRALRRQAQNELREQQQVIQTRLREAREARGGPTIDRRRRPGAGTSRPSGSGPSGSGPSRSGPSGSGGPSGGFDGGDNDGPSPLPSPPPGRVPLAGLNPNHYRLLRNGNIIVQPHEFEDYLNQGETIAIPTHTNLAQFLLLIESPDLIYFSGSVVHVAGSRAMDRLGWAGGNLQEFLDEIDEYKGWNYEDVWISFSPGDLSLFDLEHSARPFGGRIGTFLCPRHELFCPDWYIPTDGLCLIKCLQHAKLCTPEIMESLLYTCRRGYSSTTDLDTVSHLLNPVYSHEGFVTNLFPGRHPTGCKRCVLVDQKGNIYCGGGGSSSGIKLHCCLYVGDKKIGNRHLMALQEFCRGLSTSGVSYTVATEYLQNARIILPKNKDAPPKEFPIYRGRPLGLVTRKCIERIGANSWTNRYCYSALAGACEAEQLDLTDRNQMEALIANHSHPRNNSLLLVDSPSTCIDLLKSFAAVGMRISAVSRGCQKSKCSWFAIGTCCIVSVSNYVSIKAKSTTSPLEDHFKKRCRTQVLVNQLPTVTMLRKTNPASLVRDLGIIPESHSTASLPFLEWFDGFLKLSAIIWCKFPHATVTAKDLRVSDKNQMYNRIMAKYQLPMGSWVVLPSQKTTAPHMKLVDDRSVFIEFSEHLKPMRRGVPEWLMQTIEQTKYCTLRLYKTVMMYLDYTPKISRSVMFSNTLALSKPMDCLLNCRRKHPNALHVKSAANLTYGCFAYREKTTSRIWSKRCQDRKLGADAKKIISLPDSRYILSEQPRKMSHGSSPHVTAAICQMAKANMIKDCLQMDETTVFSIHCDCITHTGPLPCGTSDSYKCDICKEHPLTCKCQVMGCTYGSKICTDRVVFNLSL